MITIVAEKFDVGYKLAAGLGGINHEGTVITLKNAEALKSKMESILKPKGYLYTKYEGKNYAVTWAQGHLVSLKQAKDYNPEYKSWSKMPMPFFPEKYELMIPEGIDRKTGKGTGQPNAWASRQLEIIRQLFQKSEYVINATDDDREGEAIFRNIYDYLGVSVPYMRLLQSDISESAINKMMHSLLPSSAMTNKENAGIARGIGDYVVGINLTVLMSVLYAGGHSIVSIGRVQTPLLAMIVARELAIRNFVAKPFWNVIGEFTTKDGKKYKGKYEETEMPDKNKATQILNYCNGKQGKIESRKVNPTKKEVPLLYNLNALQIDAAAKYDFSAQKTLEIAQSLYEAEYTSYPRTSSRVLNDGDAKEKLPGMLKALSAFNPGYDAWIKAVPQNQWNLTKRHFNSKKVESHTAITTTSNVPKNLTEDQKKIYDLIAKSVIRIIYKPAECESTTIITNVAGKKFKTTGTVVIRPNWLVVDGKGGNISTEDPAENEEDTILPAVTEGDIVSGQYSLKEGKTTKPSRYNQASILVAMDNAGKTLNDDELKAYLEEGEHQGLGTAATQGSMIETLLNRKYIEIVKKGKKSEYAPTEKGIKLIEILPVEDLKSISLTAKWEHKLKQVCDGAMEKDTFIKEIETATSQWVSNIKSIENKPSLDIDTSSSKYTCPACGKPLRKLKWGYACSGYVKDDANSCKFAIPYKVSKSGATITDTDIDNLMRFKRTGRAVSGFVSKAGKPFSAYLIINDSNEMKMSFETGIACPKCGSPIVLKGKGWGCSKDYKECGFMVWNEVAGVSLTEADFRNLMSGKATRLIHNFTSKAGKTFDAKLKMGPDLKIQYEFPPKKHQDKNGGSPNG